MLHPKHMIVVYATGPLTTVITASSTPLHHSLIEIIKIVDPTPFSDVQTTYYKAT